MQQYSLKKALPHQLKRGSVFIAAMLCIGMSVALAGYGAYMASRATNLAANPFHKAPITDRMILTADEQSLLPFDASRIDLVDWDHWLTVNPDVVGWVTVPETSINGPIVRAPADNPLYYLTHDIYGTQNIYGCAYLDAAYAHNAPVRIISGHNMDDGKMFAPFARYTDASYAQKHAYIVLQTPKKIDILKVLMVEKAEGSENVKRTHFPARSDFFAWYQERQQNATVLLDSTSPHTLTLFVTCASSNPNEEGRIIIYATETLPA